MQIFLDDKEIEVNPKTIEEENKDSSNQIGTNIVENLNHIPNVKEITVENIPEKLTNEKLYEIFFIFGDISKIEFIKEMVRINFHIIFNIIIC